MAVETSTPYRRVVGTLIRGVGDGLLGTPSGIPLAGAKVVAEASILSATSDHYIAFDPVEGITDNNAVLRNAITGEPGLLLVVTDDPSVGVVDWTWHITITAPTLARPIEFDLPVPSGEGDLDLSTLDPVPGSGGEVVYMWRQAVTDAIASEVPPAVEAEIARNNLVTGLPAQPTSGDAAGGFVDLDGTPIPSVQWTTAGAPAQMTVNAFRSVGFVVGELGGSVLAVLDELGNDTWLQAGLDGLPTLKAKWVLVNAIGFYNGVDEPFVFPGVHMLWRNPATGETLERIGE